MINFDTIIWISTLIWTFVTPFVLLFCCKKRQEHGNPAGGPLIKSKRCNKAPGLNLDDPDLKSEDRPLGADKTGQTTDMLLQSNKKLSKNRASREPTVTKDQCDTDLRSFLSDKNQKQDAATKMLSLAPTQELEGGAAAEPKKDKIGKKGKGFGGGGKASLECTQNDSQIRTVQENVTQNDNTVEIPAKAVETKETTTKKAPEVGIDGKSTILGKSVFVGKSTVAGNNKTDPLQQPKG
uniref:Uncharacterized protein n=1 Tax=Panagrolaimus superbus TaxID=310955 RepID=A0A914Y9V8_9BILA